MHHHVFQVHSIFDRVKCKMVCPECGRVVIIHAGTMQLLETLVDGEHEAPHHYPYPVLKQGGSSLLIYDYPVLAVEEPKELVHPNLAPWMEVLNAKVHL